MAISFGGLATGLDTSSLVEQLMQAERKPLTQMENDKSYFNSRLSALGLLEGKLVSFLSKIEELNSAEELQSQKATFSSKDFFSATTESNAVPGNYQVEVVDLAQVQKSVSLGVTDKAASSFGLGTMTLTVGDNDPVDITIDASNNSLAGIMAAINESDAGVVASIINDGTDSPYRLVLTGEDVAAGFSLTSSLATFNGDVTSLTMGGYADQDAKLFGSGTISLSTGHDITLSGDNSLADIRDAINAETATTGVSATVEGDGNGGYRLALAGGTIDSTALVNGSGYAAPDLTTTQSAQQAHIRVDGIDIYSNSNTLAEAIPGISLDLTQAEEGTITSLTVDVDESAVKNQIKAFVTGYNEVISFISGQSKAEGSSAGILVGDSGINSIKRRLQSMLTSQVGSSGLTSLSQLGLETQRDGTLTIDDEVLTEAIQTDLPGMTKLLAGDEDTEGIATRFKNYLDGITDKTDGFYAGRKKTIENNVKQIAKSIDRFELRLEKREQTLYDQFNALEQLISVMNAQSDYIGKQMSALENMWSSKS